MSSIEQQSLEDRWAEFQQLDHIRDHWYWRPGWRQGRSFYTWHLTFATTTELHQLSHRVQQRLPSGSFSLVPGQWLHLTMQGLGFTDEVSDRDVHAISDAVQKRCLDIAPFDITVGPVDPDAEGIGLLINPWQPIIDLRLAIRAGIASVWSQVPEPEEPFRPHITVAYSADDSPASDTQDQLPPLRNLPPVEVHVNTVELIRLNRDEHVYKWDAVAIVPLTA